MSNITLINKDLSSLDLRQSMESVDDLLYNMESLKQFQLKLDRIQELKDCIQFQANMVSLTLLRKYILNEEVVGPVLFRRLIERYYPMNEKQIVKYFTVVQRDGTISITNRTVIKRKGKEFRINGQKYVSCINFYETDYDSDFHNIIGDMGSSAVQRFIMNNLFVTWDWELVREIHEGFRKPSVLFLLNNRGFIAQLGIQNVDTFFKNMREIVGEMLSQDIIDETKKDIEKYGFKFHSYLPLSEKFILQYQNELDWRVLGMNPHIQWNLELIALYLKKIKEQQCESDWKRCMEVSEAMYRGIETFLNDEVLSDIEKLYSL